DVTEEEALRRGAAAFVAKPVAPGDLLAVAREVIAPQGADGAKERRQRTSDARKLARQTAQTLIAQLQSLPPALSFDPRRTALLSWTGRYLGMRGVALALAIGDRLDVVTTSDKSWLSPGADLGQLFPPIEGVIDSGSSLVLPDVGAHPSFGPLAQRMP